MSILTILISSKGLSKRSVLVFSIICTTSAPFTTCTHTASESLLSAVLQAQQGWVSSKPLAR